MATEPFLVNPPRRRRRFGARRRFSLRNPFAEGLAIVGGNPRGRRRARRNAPKKRRGRAKMHRPVFYEAGPKRWSRGPRSRSRKAGIRVNRARRRMRRNPAVAAGGPLDIMGNLPYIATGAVSAIAVTAVPALTGMSARGPIFKYGTQVATAIGGGIVVGQFVGRSHGAVWALVGSAVIVADVVKTYLLGSLGLSGLLGVDDYNLEAFPETAYGDYRLEDYGQNEEEFEAFPETAYEESPYA